MPANTSLADTSPADTSPADLYRHSLRLLLDKNIPAWVALWAEDGILEFPFAPQGWPGRLEGKEAIAAYMRRYPDHIDLHDIPDLRIHQTTESDVIVVEMRAVGRLVETEGPFDMTYIAVVTVRDGLISSYRDYWNPLAVQEPGVDFTASGTR
ncbi:nuclear transport factor 2 family protein [Streptomyces sp. NPDC057199]|uniref:nuclear transport factor 2 family protein n=1 Tax=Streptomyces sp. NPDC057199 TaxID=3346047 RepID=UPI00362D0289